jgi:hypothetical protein
MSWRTILSSILLIGSVIGIILMIVYARDLRQTVTNQRSVIAEQKGAIASHEARFRQQQREADLDLARRQAQAAVLQDALVANEDVASGLARAASACPPPRERIGEEWTTTALNLCSLIDVTANSFTDFLGRYTSVTGQRSIAESPPAFQSLRLRYEALLAPANRLPNRNPWLARVYEGIAYSNYRFGNLEGARAAIDRASQLNSGSALVELTALKIACAQGHSRAQVDERYASQLSRLRRTIREAASAGARIFAERELRYFRNDRERPLVCARPPVQPSASPTASR